VRDDINQVEAADQATRQVPLREWWQIFTDALVELRVLLFKEVDLFLRGLLRSCVDPKRASVFMIPFSTLESLESVHEEGSPGLVHREAHTDIILLAEEGLVDFKLRLLHRHFVHISLLNSFSELFEGVLRLEALAKSCGGEHGRA